MVIIKYPNGCSSSVPVSIPLESGQMVITTHNGLFHADEVSIPLESGQMVMRKVVQDDIEYAEQFQSP